MYVPFLQDLFSIVPLTAQDWALVIVWTLPVLVVVELRKRLTRLASRTGSDDSSRRKI